MNGERQKRWRMAHPDRARAHSAKYRAANREKVLAYYAANYAAKAEAKRAYARAYYLANKAKIAAKAAAKRLLHPEKVRRCVTAWKKANPGAVRAYAAKWRSANRDRVTTIANRRRAREAGNGGSHTPEERAAKFARLGNRCFYCGASGRLTADHDLPIARGGTDNIANILPACRSCNCRKRTRTAPEFMTILGAKATA